MNEQDKIGLRGPAGVFPRFLGPAVGACHPFRVRRGPPAQPLSRTPTSRSASVRDVGIREVDEFLGVDLPGMGPGGVACVDGAASPGVG